MKDSPVDEKQGESKSAETPTKESEEGESAANGETAVHGEEGKSQDETQDYAAAATDDDEFVFDEDMFREWESAFASLWVSFNKITNEIQMKSQATAPFGSSFQSF
jgi:hypothetical protein